MRNGLRVLGKGAGALALGVMSMVGGSAVLLQGQASASATTTSTLSTIGASGGRLYVGDIGSNNVTSYGGVPLGGGTSASMTSTAGKVLVGTPTTYALAYDSSGDLWVASEFDETVDEYTPAEIQSGTGPAVVLSSTGANSIAGPDGLAFDSSGNLWVSNYNNTISTISEFSASSLSTSGSPTPLLVLSSSSLSGPGSLAFHSINGTPYLWVENAGTTTSVVAFDTSKFPSSSTSPLIVTPAYDLSGSSTGLQNPSGVAFDSSGDLWISNYNSSTLTEYSPSVLASVLGSSPSNVAPTLTISNDSSLSTSSLEEPGQIAFDSSGNLYVANDGGSSISEFSAAELAPTSPSSSYDPVPVVSDMNVYDPYALAISPTSAGSPQQIAIGDHSNYISFSPLPLANNPGGISSPYALTYDSSGNLWVANYGNSTIDEYTPAEISSGTGPAVVLSSTISQSIDGPDGIVFDSSGNLWIANYTNNTISEFSASSLSTSGSPTPLLVVNSVSSSIEDPEDIAFHSVGGTSYLWVANTANVVAFQVSDLHSSTGSITPTPAFDLSGSNTGLYTPYGVAFDAAGDLWISNTNSSTLTEYSPSVISSVFSGSSNEAPTLTISNDPSSTTDGLAEPGQIAFDSSGNLYVANYYSSTSNSNGYGTVSEFSASQLASANANAATTSSVSLAPYAQNSGSGSGLFNPQGLTIIPAPQITSLSTSSGSTSGGTTVTISGTNLGGATGVDVGSTPATIVSDTPTSLTITTPAGSGSQEISITTSGGTSLANPSVDSFTYQAPPAPSVAPSLNGYHLVAADGGIFSFGDANYYGSTGAMTLNKPIVGMAATPDGKGYWLVAADGGIFTFGDANYYGSTGAMTLNKPIVGMAATPDGKGYWLVAADGGIFTFGDANYYGSTGAMVLNKPIVGMAATPDGKGYWLVAADGGIFTFGDANYYGSTGAMTLNKPIVGMAATPDGKGYWLVAADGGIFTFGDANYYGSTGAMTLNKPIVGMALG